MNVTDEMHTAIQETQIALSERKNGSSWRAVSDTLGVHFATLHAVATNDFGHVSWDAFNRVRLALALQPIPAAITVSPCPDCGAVHTGRCHGKPVVQVVTLSPGEQVTRKPIKIIRRWRDLPVDLLAQAIAKRVPYYESTYA